MSPCSLLYASVLSLLPLSIRELLGYSLPGLPMGLGGPCPVQPAFLLCLLPLSVSLSSCPPFNHTPLYIFAIFHPCKRSSPLSILLATVSSSSKARSFLHTILVILPQTLSILPYPEYSTSRLQESRAEMNG